MIIKRKSILITLAVVLMLVIACTPTTSTGVPTETPVVEPTAGPKASPAPDGATIELADRTQCLFAGYGATLAFGAQRVNYRCVVPGGADVVLLDWPVKNNNIWTITQATIGHNDDGFYLEGSKQLVLEFAQVELADGTICSLAQSEKSTAIDDQAISYTCETRNEETRVLLGELMREQERWTAEVALIEDPDQLTTPGQTRRISISRLIGRSPTQVPTEFSPEPAIGQLTQADLMNGTYQLPDMGSFTLIEGEYENEYGDGATMVDRVGFIRASIGDLDNDQVDDAVVALWQNSGGSGTFIYLVAVVNRDGIPAQVAVEFLGDRIPVESMRIQDGQLLIDVTVFGPDDPLCCPSQPVSRTYQLERESLIMVQESMQEATAGAFSQDNLMNGVYELPDLGAIQLVDGLYENQYGEGATQVDRVGLFQSAIGDLNGDGAKEAAVALYYQGGGSGSFIYLAVMVDQNSQLKQTAMTFLGDRVQVQAIKIENGQLYLAAKAFAPDDALCCPSLDITQVYRLDEDILTLVEQVEKSSADSVDEEITGIVWEWERFDDTAGINDIVVPYPGSYRLELLPEGQYSLRADCNRGSGSYTASESQISLEFGPMTLAECSEGSLSHRYLELLGHVATYVVENNHLYLNLWADGGNMVFRQLTAVTGRVDGPEIAGNFQLDVKIFDPAGVQVGGQLKYGLTQFPMEFEAPYYVPSIDPYATYLLEVTIRDESGTPLLATAERVPVITQNNPAYHLEIPVSPIGSETTAE